MNEHRYITHDHDGVPLVFTPDERRTWERWRDDTPEYVICILFVLACIAVAIVTSTGPVTLGVGL